MVFITNPLDQLFEMEFLGVDEALIIWHLGVLITLVNFAPVIVQFAFKPGFQVHNPLYKLEYHVLDVSQKFILVDLSHLVEALLDLKEAVFDVE